MSILWTGACRYCPANFRTRAELEEHERSHSPSPAVRDGTIRECVQAVGQSAWKHVGDDAYSQGMDRGASQQLSESLKALDALKSAPPVPSPTGTEAALDEAKQHIAKLTAFWMENPGWAQAAEEARAFIGGVPTSAVRDVTLREALEPLNEQLLNLARHLVENPKPLESPTQVRQLCREFLKAIERLRAERPGWAEAAAKMADAMEELIALAETTFPASDLLDARIALDEWRALHPSVAETGGEKS